MNRGSLDRPASLLPACPRFNEAPIHESGKYSEEVRKVEMKEALQ